MANPIELAAFGWERADWLTDYYPDDLPEDWRLDYYANEYRQVLVPAAYWDDEPDTGDWADLAGQGLEFYFQVDDVIPEQCLDRARELGDGLKGFVLDNAALEGGALVTKLGDALQDRAVFMMYPCQGFRQCWVPGMAGGGYGAGILRLDHEVEPRDLRTYIEQYIQATSIESPILFVDAPPSVLATLRTLLDLMGL
jgi:hypothetical protein